MSVTITVAEIVAALHLSDSAEELAEATRLLEYATEAVTKHVPTAPDAIHNEAVRRLAGYLYDQPEASRGDAYSNALRNSGAARMLLPYRVHRAGYSDAMESAQAAVGSVGNPVTGIDVTGTILTITFADGATETHTLPAGGGGGGVDQTARDAAAAAQGEIDTHEGTTHNTDQTARDAAAAAASSAAANQGAINAHGSSQHNHDTQARSDATQASDAAVAAAAAAAAVQGNLTSHENSHPSGLPVGSSGRRSLKWDVSQTAWEAVSDVEVVYYGASAVGDYTHIAAALAAGLNTDGIQVVTDTYLLYKDRNSLRSDHMATLWAALSSPPPAIWALAPSHTDWIHNLTITSNDMTGTSMTFDGVVTEDFVYINGNKYDLLLSEHPGAEVNVLAGRGGVRFNYIQPAAVYAISQTAA